MVAEMMIWLEQNFCINEWEGCKDGVAKYFQPMHMMAMEKYAKGNLAIVLKYFFFQVHDPH